MAGKALIGMVFVLVMFSNIKAEIPLGGRIGDDVISLVYDPTDGNLSIDSAGRLWTALEIISDAGVFTGSERSCFPWEPHPFCLPTPEKFFALLPSGAGDTDFGNQMATDLTPELLSHDLTVDGALHPRGPIGVVDLVFVPEPTHSVWIMLIAGMAVVRRLLR